MEPLYDELKQLIIDSLNLEDISINDIETEAPLFVDGLGLDSIDALELGMAIKQKYGLTLSADNEEMKKYLDSGIFKEYKDCMIYVERTLSDGRVRKGLVGKLDLEDYDFSKGSGSLVRATEGTVLERIPPRVKIRENAPLELPHIMILIDDSDKKVIEPIAEIKDSLEKVYDFDLMMNGGHITGRVLTDEVCTRVTDGLEKLSSEFMSKYNMLEAPELIFAVGDGNHSLATAKTCWENIKKTLTPEEAENHPARFALCEIVNLHDDALEFEPIHRVMFGVDETKLFEEMNKFYKISFTNNGGQFFEYVDNWRMLKHLQREWGAWL